MRFQRWIHALTKSSRCTAIAGPIIVPLGWGIIAPEWGRSPERGQRLSRVLKGVPYGVHG